MECFVDDIISITADSCKQGGKKRLGVADLRGTVSTHEKFDFLRNVEVFEPARSMPYKRPKRRPNSQDTNEPPKETNASRGMKYSVKKNGSTTVLEYNKDEISQDQREDIFDTGKYSLPQVYTFGEKKKETMESSSDSDYD